MQRPVCVQRQSLVFVRPLPLTLRAGVRVSSTSNRTTVFLIGRSLSAGSTLGAITAAILRRCEATHGMLLSSTDPTSTMSRLLRSCQSGLAVL